MAKGLGKTAPKKHLNGDKLLAALRPIWPAMKLNSRSLSPKDANWPNVFHFEIFKSLVFTGV